MPKNKKAILITGGAGFIGSYLAEKLLARGEKVIAVDNLSTGNSKNIAHLKKNKNFKFVKGAVLEKAKMDRLARQSKQIYHLAAAVGVKTIMDKPLESFINNLKSTETILELALKYRLPLLFTSSSEVYGKNDKLPFKEDSDRVYGSAYNDRWGYALSKGSDEFLALTYYREKNLPVIIVRLFNVIGPRQASAYGMVVPRFIKQALAGQDMTIYDSGLQTRCFTDIEDIINGLVGLMDSPKAAGQIFNIGSDKEITIKALAEKIKKLTGSKSKIIFVPYAKVYGQRFEDMDHRRPDISKIRKIIGYSPKISLEESLKKIISYFHAQK